MRAREQRGSVAVVFAVAATVMVGFAAISVDVGRLYFARARASNVADLAAIAGARLLPGDAVGARSVAYEVVQDNGFASSDAQVLVSADLRELTVQIDQTHPLHFARILGFPAAGVQAAGTARVAGISRSYGAVPLGVPLQNFIMGQQVTLKLGASDKNNGGPLTPGNFQALALGQSGASPYENNLRHGYSGMVRVGDWLSTEPGNMAGPTKKAIRDRLDADPNATWTSFSRTSTRIVLVPVLDKFPNGKGEVQVVGFAMFFLEDIGQAGDAAAVTGRFVRYVWDGDMDPTSPDLGAVGVKLVG